MARWKGMKAAADGPETAKGTKRQAGIDDLRVGRPSKKRKSLAVAKGTEGGNLPISHVLLNQFYPKLQTLRAYLLSKLPSSSRLRRKKIASISQSGEPCGRPQADFERHLCRILDTTLVGTFEDTTPQLDEKRWEQFISFSQRGDESYVTLSDGIAAAAFAQSEVSRQTFTAKGTRTRRRTKSNRQIVDFVVWLLFSRVNRLHRWPKHILCDGYRKHTSAHSAAGRDFNNGQVIPGIFSVHPNQHVHALKEAPWPHILSLLGKAGERIMIDLLMDGAIFVAVEAGKGNLYQMSGKLSR
jgi:telomerase reverse transcriptase